MAASALPETWWAVARSEEVSAAKPLSVDIGDQPIVLWRDTQGIVRALEDRCAHRRAPLSLGCIRDNGWLQCGYHGWSYEGETGRLKEIPSMKDKQKFPPLYRVIAFAAREVDGFVRVCLGDATPRGATAPREATAPEKRIRARLRRRCRYRERCTWRSHMTIIWRRCLTIPACSSRFEGSLLPHI